jgi:hypothetical protein
MSIAGAAAVLGLRGDLLRFAIVEVTRSTLLASSAPLLLLLEIDFTKLTSVSILSSLLTGQAALPHSIAAFIFAREYDLHPGILSTA